MAKHKQNDSLAAYNKFELECINLLASSLSFSYVFNAWLYNVVIIGNTYKYF